MKFHRLYVFVLIFFVSLNTVVLADESKTDVDSRTSLQEDDVELSSIRDARVNFFYLLGGAGYARYDRTMGALDANRNPVKSDYVNGFAVSILGGWQAFKYFAMEAGIDYMQVHFMSLHVKYTLLFQPYIIVNRSWSIMPKVGLGVSLVTMFSEVVQTDSPAQGGLAFDIYGVVGLRANYKRFIFGVSYEHNFMSGTDDFMIAAEAGVKF